MHRLLNCFIGFKRRSKNLSANKVTQMTQEKIFLIRKTVTYQISSPPVIHFHWITKWICDGPVSGKGWEVKKSSLQDLSPRRRRIENFVSFMFISQSGSQIRFNFFLDIELCFKSAYYRFVTSYVPIVHFFYQ